MVLVIESDALLRRALARLIRDLGYEASAMPAPRIWSAPPQARLLVIEERLLTDMPRAMLQLPQVILQTLGAMRREGSAVWIEKLEVCARLPELLRDPGLRSRGPSAARFAFTAEVGSGQLDLPVQHRLQ